MRCYFCVQNIDGDSTEPGLVQTGVVLDRPPCPATHAQGCTTLQASPTREAPMAETYRVVRMYQRAIPRKRVIARGLTLEQAQAHCRSPHTSSSTCTTSAAKARTKRLGPWFDGYELER